MKRKAGKMNLKKSIIINLTGKASKRRFMGWVETSSDTSSTTSVATITHI